MLVIDSDNYSAAGIETMFFPGGEPHVKLPLYREPVILYGKLRDNVIIVGYPTFMARDADYERLMKALEEE